MRPSGDVGDDRAPSDETPPSSTYGPRREETLARALRIGAELIRVQARVVDALGCSEDGRPGGPTTLTALLREALPQEVELRAGIARVAGLPLSTLDDWTAGHIAVTDVAPEQVIALARLVAVPQFSCFALLKAEGVGAGELGPYIATWDARARLDHPGP